MKLIMENFRAYKLMLEDDEADPPQYRDPTDPGTIFKLIPPNLKVICDDRSCYAAPRLSEEEFKRIQAAIKSGEIECVKNCPEVKEPKSIPKPKQSAPTPPAPEKFPETPK